MSIIIGRPAPAVAVAAQACLRATDGPIDVEIPASAGDRTVLVFSWVAGRRRGTPPYEGGRTLPARAWRVAVAVCVLAATLAAAPAAAADVAIARVACPSLGEDSERAGGCTGVRAHAGRLAWSAYDRSSGTYALMTHAAGVTTRVPVPVARRPFDVDLGPDDRDRSVAVYSRCVGDPGGPPSGCVLREYVFDVGSERTLLPGVRGDSPLLPSRWGAWIAVVRRGGDRRRRAYLCAERPGRHPTCRRRPPGPAGAFVTDPSTGPTGLDLGPRWLAVAWRWHPTRGEMGIRRTAILLDRRNAPGRPGLRVVARAGAGLAGNAAVHSPSLNGRFVYFARGGAYCSYRSGSAFGRYDLRDGGVEEVPSPDVAGLAADAGALYFSACGAAPLDGPSETVITRAEPNPFQRPGAPDFDAARPCPAARPAARWRTQTLDRAAYAFTGALLERPSGAALAAWVSNGELRVAVRRPGAPFQAPSRVASAAFPGLDGWLGADAAGGVVAGWRANPRGNDAEITVALGTMSGRFRGVQVLERDPSAPDHLGVPVLSVAADGTASVAWTFEGQVRVAVKPSGASRFEAPVTPPEPRAAFGALSVAAGAAGEVLVAFPRFAPGGRGQEIAVVRRARGDTFGATSAVAPAGGTVTAMRAVLGPRGEAILMWNAGGAVRAVTRAAGGEFSAVQVLSTPGVPVGRDVALTADPNGRALAAWTEGDLRGRVSRVMVATAPAGGAFAPAVGIGLLRGRAQEPEVGAGRDGAAVVAWRLACPGRVSRVLAAVRRPGGRFGTAELVSGRDRRAAAPAVALNATGRPAVLWMSPFGGSAPPRAAVRFAERR